MKDLNVVDQFWQRKYEVINAEGIDLFEYDKDQIVAWNKKTIYIVDPGEAVKLKVITTEENIIKAKTCKDSLFVLTGRGCMAMDKSLKTWKEIISIDQVNNGQMSGEVNTDYISEYEEQSNNGFLPNFDCNDGIVAVSTLSGVFVFDLQAEKLEVLNLAGVPLSDMKYIAVIKKIVVIATSKKLYQKGISDKNMKEIILRNEKSDLSILCVQQIDDMNLCIWTGGGNRLFRIKLFEGYPESKRFFLNNSEVVSVKEVQEMAIKYAEVEPEKISKWRRAAKIKAILPKVSFGISESNDENIEIYKSASKHYVINGPREVDRDWSIDLSWDLSDLIWNNSQTNIDVRSKLMVQMRNDILEEVTRLYFERIRLIGEIRTMGTISEKSDLFQEKQIRVKEITAYIDAYTGGEFSEHIFLNKNGESCSYNK